MARIYYVDRTNTPQLTEAQCFKKPGKQLLARVMGSRYSFMRVGHFSVITNGSEIFVAKMYETQGFEVHVERDSEFWESSRRDRLSQVERIETAVRAGTITPRLQEVLDDCTAERNFWA